jgi:hypothetical protein
VGIDELATFRQELEERARTAHGAAMAKDLCHRQLVAKCQARAEEVVRMIEAVGRALSRPPLPYVRFKVLHRFGSQRGMAPIASWASEIEWTGAGCRRSLRLEVNQADGVFRWYWSAGDDHQSEESMDVESVSEDLIKKIVVAITDGETFDSGGVPPSPVAQPANNPCLIRSRREP